MSYPTGPQLRPLGVGERLDASFKIFGRSFLPMAKAVLVVAVPAGILDALIAISTSPQRTTVTGPFGTTTTTGVTNGWSYGAGLFAVLVISEVVTAIATASCYRIIGSSYLGQDMDWRRALREGSARFFSILWLVVLILFALVVPAAGVVVLAVIPAAAHIPALAVVMAVLGGIGWVVFAVWFGTCTRLAVPTLMIEDIRGWKAVRRSLRLCRGHWWSVFGTQLLAYLIVGVLTVVLGVVTAVVAVASHDSTTAAAVVSFFTRTASLTIATPFTAAVLVVIAIDLRVRKEGFDLQLLASHMGVAPTRAALDFIRPLPPPPWGGAGPAAWPPQYPPVAPFGRPPPPPPAWPPPPPPSAPAPAPRWPPPSPPAYPPGPPGEHEREEQEPKEPG